MTALCAAALLLVPAAAGAQQQMDLGHKTLGTLGLLAGAQPRPGLFLVNRVVYYAAVDLIGPDSRSLPVGLDVDAFADALGLSVGLPVPLLGAMWSASIGVPIVHASARTEHPFASIDRSGIADLYVEPLKLGWRFEHVDLVGAYGFYAPTGRFEPGGSGGVGRGHWTQQFSVGGAAYLDRERAWHFSALASYDLNHRKRGIDITRGDTIQIQGGAGARLGNVVTAGLVGYALWQVSDDRGSQLPPQLRGARDRAFGVGPELGVLIAPLRSQLTLRYTNDVSVRARPLGQLLFVSFTFVAWRPEPREPAKR